MFDELTAMLDKLEPLLEDAQDESLTTGAAFLAERINHPDSYVTVLGETSSGKSTLINGLVGSSVLPAKAYPTTGAITEAELCDIADTEYYAINKNATIEVIGRSEFLTLSEEPDEKLQRLKVKLRSPSPALASMRIFDTPGYGSIVEEHEEILKEFLPNSDVVIYVVQYKIGIQEEDFQFLGFLKELCRDDVKILLAINRCPEGITKSDKRVNEIGKYAEDILGSEIPVFLVDTVITEDDPLPKANELWESVASIVNGKEHRALLAENFKALIKGLYLKCDAIIQTRYNAACMDSEQRRKIADEQKKAAENLRRAIPELVDPTFSRLEEKIPRLFDSASVRIKDKVCEKVSSSKATRKDEVSAYTNNHLLPYTIKSETEDIKLYIETELSDLNDRVSDYINNAISDFQNSVEIILETNTELAVKNVGAKLAQKLGTQALRNVFASFGGAGGANAGIANAASHFLKEVGDVFGKTFSRETHNALKHFLSKIGATSMKAVSAAIAEISEVVMELVDLATWKGKLQKKIPKAVEEWKAEAVRKSIDDLKQLRAENVQNIRIIADEMEAAIEIDDDSDVEALRKNAELSERIGKELEI